MKMEAATRKGFYIGGGVGLALFAIIGLLPGSFVGGIIGLNIAAKIFGLPLNAELMPRMIVAFFMVFGVMISAIVFMLGSALLGLLSGHLVDLIAHSRQAARVAVKAK
ncbi:MAG: hypothetical protein EPN22_15855 [Nitrospirae bacterium]|nr:MAG: hypothetical protein EPN22_15855 [Nitrospirota bacterium]